MFQTLLMTYINKSCLDKGSAGKDGFTTPSEALFTKRPLTKEVRSFQGLVLKQDNNPLKTTTTTKKKTPHSCVEQDGSVK